MIGCISLNRVYPGKDYQIVFINHSSGYWEVIRCRITKKLGDIDNMFGANFSIIQHGKSEEKTLHSALYGAYKKKTDLSKYSYPHVTWYCRYL